MRRLLASWLVSALLLTLAVPLAARVSAGLTALRFLVEFLGDGRHPWLSKRTRSPAQASIRLADGTIASLWRPRVRPPHAALVLVHGLTPEGRSDARLAWAADLFARGGFAVLAPDLPGMRAQRLRPDDAAGVGAAVRHIELLPGVHSRRAVVVAISVGLAPALRALVEPATGARVRLVISIGGHAEARELVRYFTTGVYRFGAVATRVSIDPTLGRAFLAENLDLVRDPRDREALRAALGGSDRPADLGPEARAVLAVLDNRDPDRVDALLATLPAETRAVLDALSPARYVSRITSRLLLVHGREDPAIPFTESLRLAAAADPRRTRLVLVSLVGHVEGLGPAWRQAVDLLRLFGVAYEIFGG